MSRTLTLETWLETERRVRAAPSVRPFDEARFVVRSTELAGSIADPWRCVAPDCDAPSTHLAVNIWLTDLQRPLTLCAWHHGLYFATLAPTELPPHAHPLP